MPTSHGAVSKLAKGDTCPRPTAQEIARLKAQNYASIINAQANLTRQQEVDKVNLETTRACRPPRAGPLSLVPILCLSLSRSLCLFLARSLCLSLSLARSLFLSRSLSLSLSVSSYGTPPKVTRAVAFNAPPHPTPSQLPPRPEAKWLTRARPAQRTRTRTSWSSRSATTRSRCA